MAGLQNEEGVQVMDNLFGGDSDLESSDSDAPADEWAWVLPVVKAEVYKYWGSTPAPHFGGDTTDLRGGLKGMSILRRDVCQVWACQVWASLTNVDLS